MQTSRRWRARAIAAAYIAGAALAALAMLAAVLLATGVLPGWVGALMAFVSIGALVITWRPHEPESYPPGVADARLVIWTVVWCAAVGVIARVVILLVGKALL